MDLFFSYFCIAGLILTGTSIIVMKVDKKLDEAFEDLANGFMVKKEFIQYLALLIMLVFGWIILPAYYINLLLKGYNSFTNKR